MLAVQITVWVGMRYSPFGCEGNCVLDCGFTLMHLLLKPGTERISVDSCFSLS